MKIKQLYGYLKEKYQIQEVDLRSLLEFELQQGFISIFNSDEPVAKHKLSILEEEAFNLQQGYPLAYITNQQEFYKSVFYVDSNVLIPRPETEYLVDLIVNRFKTRKIALAMDIGAGSGCIGISLLLAFPSVKMIFVEDSPGATSVLLRNLRQLEIEEKRFEVFADISSVPLQLVKEKLDLVVSNPPYIEQGDLQLEGSVKLYEPSTALYAADRGFGYLKSWSEWSMLNLEPSGEAFFEFGIGQQDELSEFAILNKWNFEILKDQYDIDRFWNLKGSRSGQN